MMKIRNIKSKFALSALPFLTAAIVLFTPVVTSAQILKPGEIVYSRAPTVPVGNCDTAAIWAVGQDGSNDRFITQGLHPRISPDGRLILFKRFDPNAACGPFFNGPPRWWIRDLTTKQETNISNNAFTNFGHAFSPDTNRGSNQIMFDDLQGICRMNLDGSNRACNFFAPRMWGHMSVRGGDSMVAMGYYDNNFLSISGISTFTYDSANLQKIPNTNFGDLDPSWSNDGQTIAYAFFPGSRGEPYFFTNLFKINPDGSNRTQLTFLSPPPGEGFSYSLVWTLDNSTILNAAKINGVAGIYKIAANGSGILGTIPITPGAPPEWVGGIVPVYGEQQTASFGGGLTSGGNYSLVDTIGQAFAGQTSTGGSYNLQSGFWTNLPSAHASFDFDGDGKTDPSVFRPSAGSWYVLGSMAGFRSTPFGANGDLIAPGDFDGDGKTDTAVFRPSIGYWYILSSSDGVFRASRFGQSGDIPSTGDYDGDGKSDIAVFRPSASTFYLLYSTDNSFHFQQWGQAGDRPVMGDYDGDDKTDFAIFRPAIGTFYILKSSNAGVIGQQFGQNGDKPIAGDFDGDGKTDIAVYRPATGSWYYLQSSDNGFRGVAWGTNGDIPSAGDYDGDGKWDVAVFRPSLGVFYISQSTNGSLRAEQFGTNGDVPVPSAYAP